MILNKPKRPKLLQFWDGFTLSEGSVALLILITLGALSPHSQAQIFDSQTRLRMESPHVSDTEILWKLKTGGEYFESATEERAYMALEPHGLVKHRLNSILKAHVHFHLFLDEGNLQGLDRNYNREKDGMYLDEALLSYQLIPPVDLQVGVIDQRFLQNSILIDAQSFPGLRQIARFNWGDVQLRLEAQQSVPTNSSLSTRTVEKEPLPKFLTESLFAHWSPTSGTEFNTRFTFFTFQDLPSAVAEESRLYGNSTRSISQARSLFRYNFQGYETGIQWKQKWGGGVETIFESMMIDNLEAASGRDKALHHKIGVDWKIGPDQTIRTLIGTFTIQSDAAPAYYNERAYGHTNRKGLSLGAFWISKKKNIKLGPSYFHTQPLEPRPFQHEDRLITIILETGYEQI